MFEQAPKRKIQQIKQSLKFTEKATSAKFNSGEHFCFIVQKSLLINNSNMMVGNFPKKKSKAFANAWKLFSVILRTASRKKMSVKQKRALKNKGTSILKMVIW